MGLSDRIFRRKSAQPSAATGTEQTLDTPPAEIPDATVIVPPPAGEPQTMIVSAPAPPQTEASQFPPPPPLKGQTPARWEQQPVAVPGNLQAGQATEPAPAEAAQPSAPQRPGFRERGRLRRRLRYLKQVRELGYRDLGGLVFDQHRFERGDEALIEGKVLAIETLDREIRVIEEVLQMQTPYAELFIPGVTACARCGTLHGSDAHFCPHCGLAFGGPTSVAGLGSVGANSIYDVGQQPPPAPTSNDPFNRAPGGDPTG